MDLKRVLLGEGGAWVANSEIRMGIDLAKKCVGKGLYCKLFRKSEVILEGGISEMRISIGFGLGFGDWVLGLWKELWISGKRVGFCWWVRVWRSGSETEGNSVLNWV